MFFFDIDVVKIGNTVSLALVHLTPHYKPQYIWKLGKKSSKEKIFQRRKAPSSKPSFSGLEEGA